MVLLRLWLTAPPSVSPKRMFRLDARRGGVRPAVVWLGGGAAAKSVIQFFACARFSLVRAASRVCVLG